MIWSDVQNHSRIENARGKRVDLEGAELDDKHLFRIRCKGIFRQRISDVTESTYFNSRSLQNVLGEQRHRRLAISSCDRHCFLRYVAKCKFRLADDFDALLFSSSVENMILRDAWRNNDIRNTLPIDTARIVQNV